jgi:hypothetical protein
MMACSCSFDDAVAVGQAQPPAIQLPSELLHPAQPAQACGGRH